MLVHIWFESGSYPVCTQLASDLYHYLGLHLDMHLGYVLYACALHLVCLLCIWFAFGLYGV